MRFKSLVTIVLTLCLAVLTSNAMAKGKKSGKSDKSYKHSEKSDKSNKRSGKRSGKGYGHCKSDKSGKRRGKKRGRGRNRDCGDDNEEPPVLVCLADIEEDIRRDTVFDEETGEVITGDVVSISYQGQVCAIGDEVYDDITVANDDGSYSTCSLDAVGSSSSLSNRQESTSNYWYEMDSFLVCTRNN